MRRSQIQLGVIIGLVLLMAGGFVLLTQAASAQYPARAPEAAQVPPDQSDRQRQPSGPAGDVKINPPANPAVVLYDQLNNAGTSLSVSERETTGDPLYDNQGADDFVVPAGQTWLVDMVEVNGSYYGGTGPADSVNVYFYANAGALPGAAVYSQTNIAPTAGLAAGDFVLTLSPGPNLAPGTYWVSVQANMTFATNGQWGWTTRTVGANSPSAWRNPGDGYVTGCTSWGVRGICVGTPTEPDNMYRLSGTIGGGTATATVVGATATRTVTPSGATATATVNPCLTFVQEVEPNNTFTNSNPIPSIIGAEVRGGITPAGDVDYFSFPAIAGDRIWTYINTSNAAPSTDSILTLVNAVSTTIQLDDDNGFQSTLSSAIAGGVITQTGIHALQVRQFGGATIMAPYSLYLNRTAGAALPESEPNDTFATADPYSFGTVVTASIPITTDLDVYTFTLALNDKVVIQVDGDPDRNGTNLSRVNQFNPNLELLDSNGALITLVDSDSQGGNGGLLSENLVYTNTSAVSTTFGVRIRFDPSTPVEDDVGIYNLHLFKVVGQPCVTPTSTVGVPVTNTATRTITPIVTPTRTGTAPPAGSVTATPCASGPIVVQGSITTGDPTQTNRLFRDGVADTCAAPGTCGAPLAGTFHYDTYTYTNSSAAAVCVTVDITTACTGTNFIFSGAYLGSFNPANICQNWIADVGGSPNPTGIYSFNVPAGATFVVNVHEVTANAGCASYTMTITGLAGPCPPTATATTTVAATMTRTGTAVATGQPSSTRTAVVTGTGTAVVTGTAVATGTSTAVATATVCTITFTDVDQNNPFYLFIRCLACRQIVSGYSDGTFRWGADVTRGQLSKIIAGAANLQTNIPTTQQTFNDVPNTNVFWLFIERLASVNAISGYQCGGPGEPCDPFNRPYFRWGAPATRGQIAKITAVTAGWNGPIPTTQQTFTDVPSSNPFWIWIEELASRNIISGYGCGGPGEPCDPQNRPYFRWGNNATRGQMSKIAASSFFPNCQTPADQLSTSDR